MNTAEKDAFANEAEQALKHELVTEAVDELVFTLRRGDHREGLVRYGIRKIAMYVATIARAHALGIDPDVLRITDKEV